MKSSTNFRNIRRGRRGRGRSRNKGIWRKDFNPWSGGRGKGWNQVTGVFNKIRRSLRRVKWKYARSVEGFCGRKRSFPVCKMGVRLDNDGIHPPTLPPERGGGDRGEDRWRGAGRASVDDEKNLFFPSPVPFLPPSLPLFPSIRRCIVIKEARGGLASFDIVEGFFQDGPAEGNFPRGRPISSRLI